MVRTQRPTLKDLRDESNIVLSDPVLLEGVKQFWLDVWAFVLHFLLQLSLAKRLQGRWDNPLARVTLALK